MNTNDPVLEAIEELKKAYSPILSYYSNISECAKMTDDIEWLSKNFDRISFGDKALYVEAAHNLGIVCKSIRERCDREEK